MERSLTNSSVPAEFTPAQVRVHNKLKMSLLASKLKSDAGGFLHQIKESFLTRDREQLEQVTEKFRLFVDDAAFSQTLESGLKPENPEFGHSKNKTRGKINAEFRKILGTEMLKLAEALGKLKLSVLVRQALIARKRNEVSETKTQLLIAMRMTSTPALAINSAALLIGEWIVFENLIATFYGDETKRLITSTARVYEELVAVCGFKLGIKSWHEPLYTVTNLHVLIRKALEVDGRLSNEARKASLVVASFIQRAGKIHEEKIAVPTGQKNQAGEDIVIEKIIYSFPPIRLTGYNGEHAFAGHREFFSEHTETLKVGERSFIENLETEALVEKRRAIETAGEALQYDQPFEMIELVEKSLDLYSASQFDLRYQDEMSYTEALELTTGGQEILALSAKVSNAAKVAIEAADRAKTLRRRKSSRIDAAELTAQAVELERFASALEQEIASRIDLPEIGTDAEIPALICSDTDEAEEDIEI